MSTEDLSKAIDLGKRAVEALRKSHVKGYQRTTASGATVSVKEHDDSRHPHPIKAHAGKLAADAQRMDKPYEEDNENWHVVHDMKQAAEAMKTGDHAKVKEVIDNAYDSFTKEQILEHIHPDHWKSLGVEANPHYKKRATDEFERNHPVSQTHDDSRKATNLASLASQTAIKTGNPAHHRVAANMHQKAAEKYHQTTSQHREHLNAAEMHTKAAAEKKDFNNVGTIHSEHESITDARAARDAAQRNTNKPVSVYTRSDSSAKHGKRHTVVEHYNDDQSPKKAPAAKEEKPLPQSDKNESKWDDLPDDHNPRFAMQSSHLSSKSLGKMATGKDDPVHRAKEELANRGQDSDGKWVGFDKADAHHGLTKENRHKDDTDNDDTQAHFRGMASSVLSAAVKGQLDLKKRASHELANRGHDHNGKWIGFDAANKLHGVK